MKKLTQWFNPKTYGEDPDPRFSLANERTFLAWIRTGLAFLAAAMALDLVPTTLITPHYKNLIVICSISIAIFIGATSSFRWRSVEVALRIRRSLPITTLMPLLSITLLAVSLIVAAYFGHWAGVRP